MSNQKISRYVLNVPYTHRGVAYAAVHHFMTGADCILPQSVWERVVADDPSLKNSAVRTTLAAQGFLVPADTDEFQLFREWRGDHARNFREVKSRVLFSRKCDNDCRYCFVAPHLRRGHHMRPDTAEQMDRFHTAFIDAKRPLSARDAFLGGEPFLNFAVMHASARRRFDHCRKRGISYRFSITTNGKHLSVARIEALCACGLDELHVSLAGPAGVHDYLRPSLGNKPNYHRVLDKLAAIGGRVPIVIEYQYDAGAKDYRRIGEMIADFRRLNIPIARVEPSPILPRREKNRFSGGFGDLGILAWIHAELEAAGFPVERAAPLFGCIGDLKAYLVYDVDGSIIPCPSLQLGERAYGHVATGIDYVAESQLLRRHFPQKCRACAFLPACMGGCRLRAEMQNGDFNGVICNREHLETVFRDYLQDVAKRELEKRDASGDMPASD